MDLLRSTLPEHPDEDHGSERVVPFPAGCGIEALAHGREQNSGAAKALARWFRQARRLGSRDRPVVSEAVYGMIRYEHLLIRAGARSPEDLHEYWCRMMTGDRFWIHCKARPLKKICPRHCRFLLCLHTAMAGFFGAQLEAAQLAQSLMQRAPVTIRANHARLDRDELARRLAAEGVPTQPCPMALHGLHLGKRVALGNLETYRLEILRFRCEQSAVCWRHSRFGTRRRVLDLCAGAGGKSLAIAATGATVQAWDIRPRY